MGEGWFLGGSGGESEEGSTPLLLGKGWSLQRRLHLPTPLGGGGRVPYVHTPHVLEMPSPMANTLNGSDSDSCSRMTWG